MNRTNTMRVNPMMVVLVAAGTLVVPACKKASSAPSTAPPAHSAAALAAGNARASRRVSRARSARRSAGGAAAAAGASPRVVVPISQLKLSDGTLRYSVPVQVGNSKPIQAMLDTGSYGLRVLAQAVSPSDYRETGRNHVYHYASGATLEGPLANATIRIGDASIDKPVVIQVVKTVKCGNKKPHCPVSKLAPGDYRIGGDGLARQGFEAILGISIRSPRGSGAINPLVSFGDQAYLVDVPEPGASAPGQLIIDPGAQDRGGFQMLPVPTKKGNFELPLCLDTGTTRPTCPPARLDTGARAGLRPYYVFSVLYDAKSDQVGVKARHGA